MCKCSGLSTPNLLLKGEGLEMRLLNLPFGEI